MARPPKSQERYMEEERGFVTPCWTWLRATASNGYGSARDPRGKLTTAHRVLYEEAKGPIPEGFDIDHLCRNRNCVNPDHLEAVSRAENLRRGIKGILTTHCPSGHEYNESNTYVHPTKGWRTCRACRAAKESQRRKVLTCQ